MAKVYVSEYDAIGTSEKGSVQVPIEPPVTTQVLDTTGTHLSAAFNARTRFVRLHADAIVSFKFGASPTAATTDARLAANQTEYFGVVPNASIKVDVIANT